MCSRPSRGVEVALVDADRAMDVVARARRGELFHDRSGNLHRVAQNRSQSSSEPPNVEAWCAQAFDG